MPYDLNFARVSFTNHDGDYIVREVYGLHADDPREVIEAQFAPLSRDGYVHVAKQKLYSTDDLKKYTEIGRKYFSRETRAFFNSYVGKERIIGQTLYFVTSEKFAGDPLLGIPDGERAWTLRKFENGKIETVGEFQQYKTREAANRALAAL